MFECLIETLKREFVRCPFGQKFQINRPFRSLGNIDIVKFLLEYGASPYKKDHKGRDCIDLAFTISDRVSLIRVILAIRNMYPWLISEYDLDEDEEMIVCYMDNVNYMREQLQNLEFV